MARDDPSKYRPGHRARPRARGDGKMSENRAAWIKTVIGQFVLMLDPPTAETPTQVGTDVRFFIPRPGSRDVTLNLTALTVEELDALSDFFTLLIDTARPVCEERDKVAQDAYDNGDDSHARSYRQPPQVVVRSGAILADREGLRGRPSELPDLDAPAGAADGGVRAGGDALAERGPIEEGAEDDGPQA